MPKSSKWACPACEYKGATSLKKLNTHLWSKHPQRAANPPRPEKPTTRFSCDYPGCGSEYARQAALVNHKALKHPDPPPSRDEDATHETYPCRWGGCDLVLATKDDEENHLKTQHIKAPPAGEDGRYPCGWEGCEKTFKSTNVRSKHLNTTHLGRRKRSNQTRNPISCLFEDCDWSFNEYSQYVPCSVEDCNHGFWEGAQDTERDAHVDAHAANKSVVCGKCGEGFDSMASRASHIAKYHSPRHECPTCNFTGPSKTTIELHVLTCHPVGGQPDFGGALEFNLDLFSLGEVRLLECVWRIFGSFKHLVCIQRAMPDRPIHSIARFVRRNASYFEAIPTGPEPLRTYLLHNRPLIPHYHAILALEHASKDAFKIEIE